MEETDLTDKSASIVDDNLTRLAQFLDASPDAMLLVNIRGEIVHANAKALELFGYTAAELINQSVEILVPDAARGRHVAYREAYLRDPKVQPTRIGVELVGRYKDGREIPIEISLSPQPFAGTQYFAAAARDISDTRRMLRELRESEEYNRGLIESNIDALITTDPLGIITDVNCTMCEMTAFPREELIGKPFNCYFTDPKQADAGIRKVLAEDRVTNYELIMRSRNGKETVVSYNATTFKDAQGRLKGVFAAARDITEQKLLEEQLRRKNDELAEQYRRVQAANRLKSEFLANMSHELRTPLNAIIGFSELMHDGKVGVVSPEHKEYLGDILTSAKHLVQLINDILDLAKVESGKMEFHPDLVNLSKIIGEVRDVLRTLMSHKRINVTIEVDPTLTDVMADGSKLKQVLYNYLSNALKFTPEDGKVTVRAKPEGTGYYRIEVEDSGIGIKTEDMRRLFIEFQQLDSSMAKKYQGTGLGLALTKRIVEAQGGRVGVSSVIGKGCIFYAMLPRTMWVEVEAEAPQTTWINSNTPSVLIIDDDAQDRTWLQQILKREGYNIEMVADGVQALDRCRTRRYDVILLDIMLPDVSGWDILRSVRAQGPNQNTPVVVVSVTRDASIGQAFAIQDFLVKPVNREALLRTLKEATIDPKQQGRVLVIDDDLNTLKLMDKSLVDLGYRVFAAQDGTQGLYIAQNNRPDAVILDLLMPGIDGFEFLRLFRRIEGCANVPTIIWTVKDLTPYERKQLYNTAQAIVVKGSQEGVAPLLNELRKHLSPQALDTVVKEKSNRVLRHAVHEESHGE